MKQTDVRELDSGEQLLPRTFHDSINVSQNSWMLANDPTWRPCAICLLFTCYASQLIKAAMDRMLGEFASACSFSRN